jgi:hypothetical protein
MNHQEYRVFCFEFAASGKWHNVAVASTDRKEAGALILAMHEGVTGLRELPVTGLPRKAGPDAYVEKGEKTA